MSALKVHNATTSKPLSPTAESQGTQQGVAVQLAEGHGSCRHRASQDRPVLQVVRQENIKFT